MNNVLTSTLQKGYNYITNNDAPSQNIRIQLLEPLSIIIKLGIISLKPVGTKIAVFNNKLHIQNPTIMQGPIRWTYGVTREDIHLLYNPITKAIHNYSPYFNSNYKPLFEFAIKGLEVLKDSYYNQSSILSHALEYYIFIIKKSFDGTDTDKIIEPNLLSLDNIFADLWSNEDINVVINMFNIAYSNIVNKQDYIIAITAILSTKRTEIKDIIQKTAKHI
jgi:hypothetical protein